MNTSFPIALVRAYLAALGQITAHTQHRPGKGEEKISASPNRRSTDRDASAPQPR